MEDLPLNSLFAIPTQAVRTAQALAREELADDPEADVAVWAVVGDTTELLGDYSRRPDFPGREDAIAQLRDVALGPTEGEGIAYRVLDRDELAGVLEDKGERDMAALLGCVLPEGFCWLVCVVVGERSARHVVPICLASPDFS